MFQTLRLAAIFLASSCLTAAGLLLHVEAALHRPAKGAPMAFKISTTAFPPGACA